jgi:DNA-binding transcriptional LysR family regulator
MEIAGLTREPSGEIRIGIGGHRLTSLLALALRAFQIRFPKIRLDIVNITTPQAISLLRAGNLDLGVITLPVNATDLRTEKLFSEELIVVVRRSDPLAKGNYITPAQIATLPLVLYDHTTSTRAQLDGFFQREKIAPKVALELSSVETMEIMVEAGFGATIVPASTVLGTLVERRLCALRIKGRPPTREVGFATTHFSRLPKVVEELCRLIRDRFQEIRSQMA